MLSLPSFTISQKYSPECALFCCYVKILLTYHWKALGYYFTQTMLSNFLKWYTDHFVRGQNWIFLKCDIWTDFILVQAERGERAVHKSFLDIAASLPQTHFLPASLCLSSKLYNPCQSCLHCGLKWFTNKRREDERTEGEESMERAIISSAWSCVPHTYGNNLSAIASTASVPFF